MAKSHCSWMAMAGASASNTTYLQIWRFLLVLLFVSSERWFVLSQEQYLVKTIKSFEKGVFFYDIEVDRNHPDFIYATDLESHCIRVYNNKTGEVKVFAGQEKHGYQDGYRLDALFYKPRELCQTSDGSLYVVDSGNFVIRKIDTITGNVTTVAGNHSESGSKDGAGSEARFTGQVVGIKCLADGTLLVADPGDPSKEGGGTLREVACPNCSPPPSPPPPPRPSPSPRPPAPMPPQPTGIPSYAKLSIATNIIFAMLIFIIVIPKFLPSDMGHDPYGQHRNSSMYHMGEEAYAPLMPEFGIPAYPTNSITSTTSSRNGRRHHRKNNNIISQRFNLFTPSLPHGYSHGPPSMADSMEESTMATHGTAGHVYQLMHEDMHDSLPPTPYHPDLDEMQPNLLRRSAGHRSEADDFMYPPEFESDADLDSQPATPYASDTDEVQHVTRHHPFASGRANMLTAHLLQQHNMVAGSNLAPAGSGMSSASALPPLPSARPPPNAPGRPPLPRSSNRESKEGKRWSQATPEQRTPGTSSVVQTNTSAAGMAGISSQAGSEEGVTTTPVRVLQAPPTSPFASAEAQHAGAPTRDGVQPMRDLGSVRDSPQQHREAPRVSIPHREGGTPISMMSPPRMQSESNSLAAAGSAGAGTAGAGVYAGASQASSSTGHMTGLSGTGFSRPAFE